MKKGPSPCVRPSIPSTSSTADISTAASSLTIYALDLSNKGGNLETHRVSSNFSYEFQNGNVQTLWANNEQGDDIEGLLYVPDLPPSVSCNGSDVFAIPSNVTRRSDLPPANYAVIALAPWLDQNCVTAYLTAAQTVATAFIFYLPNNDTNTPPPVTSSVWNLNQGGPWGILNNFPIYAIPGAYGSAVMDQLAQYSGPTSQLPNSNALLPLYGNDDYIRLYVNFNTGGGPHYPTLWAFLLIILGIVLVLLAITSLSMRWKQRRNRNALHQRILAGEVDLELLGVKKPPRMTQADIDAIESVKYIPSEEKPPLPLPASSTSKATPAPSPQDYNQTTCPICLEDYVAHETTVRVLPCHHIYHPECIDPHLLASSSLCPVCKARVPTQAEAGQTNPNDPSHLNIPPITNAMVRRERYLRQVRARGGRGQDVVSPVEWFQRTFGRPLLPPVGRAAARRQTRAQMARDRTPGQVEMGPVAPAVAFDPATVPLPPSPAPSPVPAASSSAPLAPSPPSESPPPQTPVSPRPPQHDTEAHREWARRRASTLLHRHSRANGQPSSRNGNTDEAAMAELAEQRAQLPTWRRGLNTVFPGFR